MPWKKSEPMDQRREFALKALGTLNFRALCQEYGISTKTGYKWRERLMRQGLEGMAEESRRPRISPKQLSEREVCEMVKLKLVHRHWGPRKIRTLYHRRHGQAPSESSFKRILEQVGLTMPRRVREGPREGGRLSSGRRGLEPNEVWTVDFKGWWRWGEARRCEPLTIRDEFSRYVLELRAMDNARSQTVREAFERIFARHGLPQAIRSDNGAPFASVQALHGLSRLSAWWVALGIDLERGRPAHPQDNGGHERLHRDIARELECLGQGATAEALELWREEFNHERPHEALGMRCPAELYRDSARRYHGAEVQLSYPGMTTRLVDKNGNLNWKKQKVFLTGSLAGWNVGLQGAENGQLEVWFGRLLLGHFDPQERTFLRAELSPQT
jgi:transposase InsO family protein